MEITLFLIGLLGYLLALNFYLKFKVEYKDNFNLKMNLINKENLLEASEFWRNLYGESMVKLEKKLYRKRDNKGKFIK